MEKFSRVMEWLYLTIAIVFFVEVFRDWNVDRQKALISILFGALALFMFIFKRRFRNRRS